MEKNAVWLGRIGQVLDAVRVQEQAYVRANEADVTLEQALEEHIVETAARPLSMSYTRMLEVHDLLAQKVARGEPLNAVDTAALEYLAAITDNDHPVEMHFGLEGDFGLSLSYEGALEKFRSGLRFGLTQDQFSLAMPWVSVEGLRITGKISPLTGEALQGLKRCVLSAHLGFTLKVSAENVQDPEKLVEELRASVSHEWQPLPDVTPALTNVKALASRVA